MNPGLEQAFIGIDVPNTGNEGLIQEGGFDRSRAASQLSLQILGIEVAFERFRPQTR
tara:strand:- start:4012 stop:4182 length:171 start_codon:yes stop_codon:yes gene_type:complete